ncbi:MAG: AAA family ATPase [Isosphaeraceae bacterium]
MTTKTQTKTGQREARRQTRTLLRPEEFADTQREWLAEGVLLAGSPAVLAGERIGLTWFAADLAVSLATGTSFLGHFPVPRRRRTALYVCDTAYADVRGVVHAVAKSRGADLGDSELRLGRQGAAFRTRSQWEKVVNETREAEVEVVVIDTIRGALSCTARVSG